MTTEAVYKFMKKENRPHSANDVISALDKDKHGKAVIQKALDKLVDIEKLFCKTSGKQKVYCIAQKSKQNLDELKHMERELKAHSNEQIKKLQEIENELKIQEAAYRSLSCGMSLDEAVLEREKLQENNGKLSSKLDELMESSGTEDLGEVKKKTEKCLNLYKSEYTKRKRICNDILDCILESYPGSKKQLYQEIGINEV